MHSSGAIRSPSPMLNTCCPLLGLAALVMWLLSGTSRRASGQCGRASSVVLPAAASVSVLETCQWTRWHLHWPCRTGGALVVKWRCSQKGRAPHRAMTVDLCLLVHTCRRGAEAAHRAGGGQRVCGADGHRLARLGGCCGCPGCRAHQPAGQRLWPLDPQLWQSCASTGPPLQL